MDTQNKVIQVKSARAPADREFFQLGSRKKLNSLIPRQPHCGVPPAVSVDDSRSPASQVPPWDKGPECTCHGRRNSWWSYVQTTTLI